MSENSEPTANNTEPTADNNELVNADLSQEEIKRLQTELQNYRRAMEQEFDTATKDMEDADKIYEGALNFFKKESPSAAAQIVFLSRNSTSDSTRLNASKYILDCLRKGMVDSADDPVSEILRGLMASAGIEEPASEPANSHDN